jgi:hypothetical protein
MPKAPVLGAVRRAVAAAGLAAAVAGCTPDAPPDCVRGTLTPEGLHCQTLRDGADRLYSFYADMQGYRLGEDVCVCGPPAEMSFCQQGTVLEVRHLGRRCPAPP